MSMTATRRPAVTTRTAAAAHATTPARTVFTPGLPPMHSDGAVRHSTFARPLAAAWPRPMPAFTPSLAPPPDATMRQVATVEHQGTVIAFARRRDDGNVYYNILDLKVSTDVDDAEWTGYNKLALPEQVRPLGLGILTVGNRDGSVVNCADVQLKALSDDKYVHLFQQSTRGTLLLNRLLYKRAAAGGIDVPVLEPVWEVRFQRSQKQDVPDGPKDSQSYTTPDDQPFIEPTIELSMIRGLADGRFAAQLLPDQSGTARRWQFFAVGAAGALNCFSFPVDEFGLPDLTGARLDESGEVEPDMSLTFSLQTKTSAPAPLPIAGAPTACLFTLNERVRATGGDDLLLKRATRDLVAFPVIAPDGKRRFATVDFALGKDGRLARLPQHTDVTPVVPGNYALEFSSGNFLGLPADDSLKITGGFKTSFWLYPESDPPAAQYVFRGDPATAAAQAAPYVMVTPAQQIEVGFGDGSRAVAARTAPGVVKTGQWVHVEARFDPEPEHDNFTVMINHSAVPLTGADQKAPPTGSPLTTISSAADGLVAVLDSLVIDTLGADARTVGDWPLDEVVYDVPPGKPPYTPDRAGKNNAAVFGARQVASSAPIPEGETEGHLYVDGDGLSAYAGMLTFAEPADSGSLLAGADGLVHLYFAGLPQGDQDGAFSVAQYDAESARAVFEAGWRSTAARPQAGAVSFTAARSGAFMNQASIEIGPAREPDLCDVEICDGLKHAESWLGVPRYLDPFAAVLNGTSTDDPGDRALREGKRVFYDNAGRYAAARLRTATDDSGASQGAQSSFTLLSRQAPALQLTKAEVSGVDPEFCDLTLRFEVHGWQDSPIVQRWPRVPAYLTSLGPVLAGTSQSYDYKPTESANATIYGLLAADAGGVPHTVLLVGRPGTPTPKIRISSGGEPDLCTVVVDLNGGGRIELPGVPREQNLFADKLNAEPSTARHLFVFTDGLTASLRDVKLTQPAAHDMRAWAALLCAFPEGPPAPDALLPAQSVPAAIRQHSTLTVGGDSRVLRGASTMFRALAVTQPTDGTAALVQDTADRTGGSAGLVTAAVNGGWVRVSPHKSITVNGKNYIKYAIGTPAAQVLATAGDMTAESWFQPGMIHYGDSDNRLMRPRIANYCRVGSVQFPDEEIRWTMGLWPRPALRFGRATAAQQAYTLRKYANCTLQLTLSPEAANNTGTVMLVQTTGVVMDYLRVAVDAGQHVVATYLDSKLVVTSDSVLVPGTWRQITVTLRNENNSADSPVRLRVYVDGRLEKEGSISGAKFDEQLSVLKIGVVDATLPMRANGAYMWKRELSTQDVAATFQEAPDLADEDLVVAWYLNEGSGRYVTNAAASGNQGRAEIKNMVADAWVANGAYGAPWVANRFQSIVAREPALHGWHHLAALYASGYAIGLDGTQYADCGRDQSLDCTDTFSLEAHFTPTAIGTDQQLVSKPGNYELGLNQKGAVVFSIPTDSSKGTVVVASDGAGSTGKFYTEDGVACYAAAVVSTGTVKPPPSSQGAYEPKYFLHVTLYINGSPNTTVAFDDLTDPVNILTSSARLNLGRSGLGGASFIGLLSDVRLWSRALTADEIKTTQITHATPSWSGLVSGWRWSEGSGKYGYDENGLNTAVLTANNLWRLYEATSRLTMVVNGVEQTDPLYLSEDVDERMYGSQQFTVGAVTRKSSADDFDFFNGGIGEVRLWNLTRTAEQVREHMYRVLTGVEPGLVGYWEFNAGSGALALDSTGYGNSGTLAPPDGPPVWTDGMPPLSNEAKEVYNVLGGQQTVFTERITGTPSVSEYADTRRDAYGLLYSVMKRSYGADRLGRARLISGYTVGGLDTVYGGQVQTDPSVIGYIEGAPPIPSENQTDPYWTDFAFYNSYSDCSKIRLSQSESVVRTFRGGKANGGSTTLDGAFGLYLNTDAGVDVDFPGGAFSTTVATIEGRLGYAGGSSAGQRDESELEFGYGKTTRTVDEMSLDGDWEPADRVLNPQVGRRYVPDNNGYAVVKSLTADMYLVRLQGSNTVVKTVLVPDADIPEDVNILSFPINPRYTKNGTLDGMVGFVPDPDHPYAQLQPESYFRPIEAYAIKRAVERQDKTLEAYYRQFSTERLSRGLSLGAKADPAGERTGYDTFKERTLPEDPSYDWAKGLAKRAIVNTYVWSAQGGLHTEQSEMVDSRSESYGGISSWDMTNGLVSDLAAAMVTGNFAELDATFGSSIEVVSTRGKQSETGFGLDVEFAPERYLRRPTIDESTGTVVGFDPQDAPGKVTDYRFMSFLIPQNADNFTLLMSKVIDQNWLYNSAQPEAAALRTAFGQANGTWRVMHRATFVSRVPPPLGQAPYATPAPPVTEPANLESNALVIDLVRRLLGDNPAPAAAQIGAAVTTLLGDDEPGRLKDLLPWWADFFEEARDVRSEAYLTLNALRVDLLGYLVQMYAARLAQAGGEAVAALRANRRR